MPLSKTKHLILSLAISSLLVIGLFVFFGEIHSTVKAADVDLFVTPGGGGSCSHIAPCSLATALASASDGDTIYLAAGNYTGTEDAVIKVTQNITIVGGWDGKVTYPPVLDSQAYPSIVNAERERRGAFVGESITVTLQGFTITNGIAELVGGGLYARDTDLTLNRMGFYSNVISSSVVSDSFGGGAMIHGGTLLVEDSTFRANSVRSEHTESGGGLAISNTLSAEVVNNIFRDNDSWFANGLYFWSEYDGINRPLLISGNEFIDNGWGYSAGDVSGGYHGAVEIVNADARIVDNHFVHNKASNGRGTLGVYYSDLILEQNSFYDNVTYSDASAVYLYYLSSPFTMTNNMIVANRSTHEWVTHFSMYIKGSDGLMVQNTIARNTNTYGVLLDINSTVQLTNTILVSHTVGISVTASSNAFMDGTLWGSGIWANDFKWGGDGGIFTGTINIEGDPGFVDYTNGDYHINNTSAALDAGIETDIFNDIDGDPRPSDGDGDGISKFDIGADEFLWIEIFLPLILR